MRRILFATDFSSYDTAVFQQACKLALAYQAKLIITHVDDAHSSGESDHLASQQELSKFIPDDLEIEYQHILRTGDPTQIMLDLEREYDVDLIVLGTHGRKGVQRLLSGSVAESIIRSSTCPVATVRQVRPSKNQDESIQNPGLKILVPTDFSVHSYVALDFASTIAVAIDAAITILHVDGSTDKSTEKIREGISSWSQHRELLWEQLRKVQPREDGIQVDYQMLNSPATNSIIQFANENNYDYIVLGTHGRSGVGRALLGSVAEYVVRNANCPVITVKPNNKPNSDLHHWKMVHHPPN